MPDDDLCNDEEVNYASERCVIQDGDREQTPKAPESNTVNTVNGGPAVFNGNYVTCYGTPTRGTANCYYQTQDNTSNCRDETYQDSACSTRMSNCRSNCGRLNSSRQRRECRANNCTEDCSRTRQVCACRTVSRIGGTRDTCTENSTRREDCETSCPAADRQPKCPSISPPLQECPNLPDNPCP